MNSHDANNEKANPTVKRQSKYLIEGPGKRSLVRAADRAGYVFLRPRQGGTIDLARIRKILLVRLDHIGDLLMTTPAIRALRKAYPTIGIHLLTKNSNREAVELNPHLDRVIFFDAPWTIARGKKAGLREILDTARGLRKTAYDCAIGFRSDLREALLIAATRANFRIGYGARGGGFCYTHLLPPAPGRHEILRAIDLLSPLGVVTDGVRMEILFSPEDRERAAGLLAHISREPGQQLVGIHPGAASPFKRWSEDGFARLGDLLLRRGNLVILLGSESDRGMIERIGGKMQMKPAAVFPGGIRTLAALIAELDCLVANDSAPAHIAQAVGTRAVILYGPTYDTVTGPLDRSQHAVIRQPVPCSPCWLPGGKFRCEYNLHCWKGLSADQVAEAVAASFNPHSGNAS